MMSPREGCVRNASACEGEKNHPAGGDGMRQQQPRVCGLCGRGTPTLSGDTKVWHYEPRADFYCAAHWEEAFEEDRSDNIDNDHWMNVTLPLLELTRHTLRAEARPLVAL